MNKSSPYPFFRRPKDNVGWAVIIFLAVAILWQVLELLLYGEIQPRRVDDIIGLVWMTALYNAYNRGYRHGYDDGWTAGLGWEKVRYVYR